MSRDEVLAELLEPPRQAFVPMPDTRVIERPGWRQLVTPSVVRGMNQVSLAQLDDEVDIEATIDAAIAEYRGARFVWRVGPDGGPPDLGQRLLRRGLTYELSYGMARSTDMNGSDIIDGDKRGSMEGSALVECVDNATLAAFTTTMAAGWNMDAGSFAAVHERVLEHGLPHFLWLARVDGEPAAAAGSVLFARSVYLLGGVTLERFRGRGAYRALVTTRLAHGRAQGIPLATCIARAETSAPILEQLGSSESVGSTMTSANRQRAVKMNVAAEQTGIGLPSRMTGVKAHRFISLMMRSS